MPRKGPDTRTSRHNPRVPDLPGEPAERLTSPGQHSFVKPVHSEPNPIPPPVALDTRGKIAQTVYQLTLDMPHYDPDNPKKVLQRRRQHIPFDPRTHAQLLCRARFGTAVHTWKTLTPAEREEYNRRGRRHDPWLEGLNLFIREYCREHGLDEFQDLADALEFQLRLPGTERR